MAMTNQKWNRFADHNDEIPETELEACIFLSHVRLHLLNRLGGPLYQEHDIIIGAWQAINDARWKEIAA